MTKIVVKMKSKAKEFDPNSVPKDVGVMKWEETEKALARISFQFKVIHDLPKLDDGRKVSEYMHEALHGLRRMAQELHWRRIQLTIKK